jgi:hypothetical protein
MPDVMALIADSGFLSFSFTVTLLPIKQQVNPDVTALLC